MRCSTTAAAAVLLVAAAAASAQDRRPSRPGQFDFYVLALSWSPSYCEASAEKGRTPKEQCGGRPYSFVVHGLWPEGRSGAWPQWCPSARKPSSRDLAANLCMTPSAALLAHEWAKHGACMVSAPDKYFRVTRILWNSLRWPDFDRISRTEDLTAGQVRRAFADANRYWEPEHVGIVVNERGWLTELRLCYGRDFMPARCDARRFGPPDSAQLKIWRGL